MTMKTEETEDEILTVEDPEAVEVPPIASPSAPAAPRASAPDSRTAEQWAEAKGMLPEFVPIAAPFAPAGSQPGLQHNPSYWRFAATRVGMGWPIGKELTEAEFDSAVETALSHTYR